MTWVLSLTRVVNRSLCGACPRLSTFPRNFNMANDRGPRGFTPIWRFAWSLFNVGFVDDGIESAEVWIKIPTSVSHPEHKASHAGNWELIYFRGRSFQISECCGWFWPAPSEISFITGPLAGLQASSSTTPWPLPLSCMDSEGLAWDKTLVFSLNFSWQ